MSKQNFVKLNTSKFFVFNPKLNKYQDNKTKTMLYKTNKMIGSQAAQANKVAPIINDLRVIPTLKRMISNSSDELLGL